MIKSCHMKKVLCLVLFSTFLSTGFAQSISFEHTGISDKPMPNFHISVGKEWSCKFIDNNYGHEVQVDQKTFDTIVSKIYESRPRYYDFDADANMEFGTYDITVILNQSNGTSCKLKIDQAKTFFKKIVLLSKPESGLYSGLQGLIKRLE